jgi:hypothetical protein
MAGFAQILSDYARMVGVEPENIFVTQRLSQLPGFFRPTKAWDLLIIAGGKLLVVVELKSHVGPSFGNNFNNRTEEALGSAVDLWTAFREGSLQVSPPPWAGYLLLLEDCAASRRPIKVNEPHFGSRPEFRDASYAQRYELFCRKLVLERQYNAACFLMSEREKRDQTENYIEPAGAH